MLELQQTWSEYPAWNRQQYKPLVGLNQFYLRGTLSLILIQFQITYICAVHICVLYLICALSQWNTYNQNTLMNQY